MRAYRGIALVPLTGIIHSEFLIKDATECRKCLQLLEYLLTQTSREGMDSVICMCQAELPALCGCGDEQVKHAAENLQAAMKPPNIAC